MERRTVVEENQMSCSCNDTLICFNTDQIPILVKINSVDHFAVIKALYSLIIEPLKMQIAPSHKAFINQSMSAKFAAAAA